MLNDLKGGDDTLLGEHGTAAEDAAELGEHGGGLSAQMALRLSVCEIQCDFDHITIPARPTE